MPEMVRYGLLPNPYTPGVLVDFYGNPITGSGSGWPTINATGSGNLQAVTGSGDTIGFNFNDQGTGGINLITGATSTILLSSGADLSLIAAAKLVLGGNGFKIVTLPTTDPASNDFLWNDNDLVVLSGYVGKISIVTMAFTANVYTLALTDAGTSQVASNGATAATITVPPGVFPVGGWVEITQTGTGKMQIAAGAGVTINWSGGSFSSGSTGTRAEYSVIRLLKVGTNLWTLSGDAA